MQKQELITFAVIATLGSLLVAVSTPTRSGKLEYVAIGALLGTMFGHATLASAWTALGPGKLVYRLPLSLAWLAVICIGFSLNIAMFGGPQDVLILIIGCAVGQWMLTQLPLWGMAVGYGMRVRRDEDHQASGVADNQFGIRQLIIITAIIGVVLGIGRAVILSIAPRFQGFGNEAAIFVFLAVASILMTLPLILAALLPRGAPIAVPVVLALIGLATWWELPVLVRVTSSGGPDLWHFILINGFQVAWILLVTGLLRLGGYRLRSRTTQLVGSK